MPILVFPALGFLWTECEELVNTTFGSVEFIFRIKAVTVFVRQ
jgi:hypothetical protein